jgi:hypothetical protein
MGRVQWEYRQAAGSRHMDTAQVCNRLAPDGWECLSVVLDGDRCLCLFRRPVCAPAPALSPDWEAIARQERAALTAVLGSMQWCPADGTWRLAATSGARIAWMAARDACPPAEG